MFVYVVSVVGRWVSFKGIFKHGFALSFMYSV